jgi:uncharacterized protein YbbC (DUF1343 family)
MAVVPGIEVFLQNPPDVVRGKRLGLVTNPAAVDRTYALAMDRLAAQSGRDWTLTRLFGPEHGVRGDALAGDHVGDATDSFTGLPVSSLYGATQKPTADMLRDVDVLLVDLQDVGVRFYTYQVTAALCIEAGAEHHRPVVILDRPNPIGGVDVEGPLLERGFESLVGRVGQPVRHGLTLGELARAANEGDGIGADLTVVQAQGWRRDQWWDQAGLPWVMPSPNLPTPDTATVYPGTCFFEGTLLSEGRGTTRPFELVGAPWVEPQRWVAALNERQLAGVAFRPVWFQPVVHKHANVQCGGVQVHVTDRDAFRPVAVGMHMLDTVRRLWPRQSGWRPAPSGGRFHIDLLYGSPALRQMMDSGQDAEAVIRTWNAAPYQDLRRRVLLYE